MSLEYAEQWSASSPSISTAAWEGTKMAVDAALPEVRKHQGYYVI
jgi:hypothetical protein